MMFRAIIFVYCPHYKKYINTLYGQEKEVIQNLNNAVTTASSTT